MQIYIDNVKRTIHKIVNELKHGSDERDIKVEQLRLAVVAYRDFGDRKRFECFNFNESIKEFKAFVGKVRICD